MKLYNFPTTTNERIQANINRLKSDLMGGELDTDSLNLLIDALLEYIDQFEDADLINAYVKLNEAGMYIHRWSATC